MDGWTLQVSWSLFLWWFLLHFLPSWRGLLWTACAVGAAAAASASAAGGFHELEMALQRRGSLSGLLAILTGKAKQE